MKSNVCKNKKIKKTSFSISSISCYLADCLCLLDIFVLASSSCRVSTQKKPLPLLIVQKLKFNGKKYSVVTSWIRMSIHILKFPHNKDFYLYKSNKMQNNFTTPTKVKYKQKHQLWLVLITLQKHLSVTLTA